MKAAVFGLLLSGALGGCVVFPEPLDVNAKGNADGSEVVEEVYVGPVTQLSISANDLLRSQAYAGVEVCSLSYPTAVGCSVTAGEPAEASLLLPRTKQLLLMKDPDPAADPATDDDAFFPSLVPMIVREQPFQTMRIPVLRGDHLKLLQGALEGASVDLGMAQIGISVSEDGYANTPPVSGVRFTTDCPSDGVFYVRGTLTLTIAREPAETDGERGMATVLNVDAQAERCRIVAQHPERPVCYLFGPGWPEDDNPSVGIVPVRPGHLSTVRFACPKP